MNALLRLVPLGIVAVVATGCASSHRLADAPRPAQPPATAAGSDIQTDAVYVATVEYIARRRGVEVVWVNPPLKRTRAADTQE